METKYGIYFYGHNKPFGFLSNFYPCSFTAKINGYEYIFNNSEQYFMAYKCVTFDPDNIELLNSILNEINPMKIKQYGRKVKNFCEKIWNKKRLLAMYKALYYKFSQNDNLLQLLLQTKNKHLYEASPTDKIWGLGYSVTVAIQENVVVNKTKTCGKNLLGILLEIIRTEFTFI